MWTLGAVLELEERLKLETFLLEHPSKLSWPTDMVIRNLLDKTFNVVVGTCAWWFYNITVLDVHVHVQCTFLDFLGQFS